MDIEEESLDSSFPYIHHNKGGLIMYVCPACNGLKTVEKSCEVCNGMMHDVGRVVDYLDDYSPYLEDEGLKLVDGVVESKASHLCVHVLHCPSCDSESKISIQEQKR
jgi:hypothetical protein